MRNVRDKKSIVSNLNKLSELKKANVNCEKQTNSIEADFLPNKWDLQLQLHQKIINNQRNLKCKLSQSYKDEMNIKNKREN